MSVATFRDTGGTEVNNIRQLPRMVVTQIRRWHGMTAALSISTRESASVTIVSTDQTKQRRCYQYFQRGYAVHTPAVNRHHQLYNSENGNQRCRAAGG